MLNSHPIEVNVNTEAEIEVDKLTTCPPLTAAAGDSTLLSFTSQDILLTCSVESHLPP